MIIDFRFNGPPGSANGGYTAGLLARELGAPGGAMVTLRRPPPLDTRLDVAPTDAGVALTDPEGQLIADASPAELGDEALVAPVSWAAAEEAAESYAGFAEHPFPTCFVCGPDRAPGDGLRLFPGRVDDTRTATPWVVPDDVDEVLVWAALDCPGGWAVPLEARPYVLGRITASVVKPPEPGSRCVIMGEVLDEEGRKARVRTTLYDGTGVPLARALSTWIAIPVV
ncbi:hypothetical protein GCM10009682_07040 [Luedemannella flava]|uniref:Thioesterase family protein n=1 Tax=Luedemannella flava TaxID=349316 RepID=A0ABP4XM15_9ACTN